MTAENALEKSKLCGRDAVNATILRQQNLVFPKCKAYPVGAADILEVLPIIREAILSKNEIVDPADTEAFRDDMRSFLTVENLKKLILQDRIMGEMRTTIGEIF